MQIVAYPPWSLLCTNITKISAAAFFKNEVFYTCAFIILLGETLTPSNYQSMFKHYLIEPAFFKLISAPFLIVSKSARKQIVG